MQTVVEPWDRNQPFGFFANMARKEFKRTRCRDVEATRKATDPRIVGIVKQINLSRNVFVDKWFVRVSASRNEITVTAVAVRSLKAKIEKSFH